MNVTVNAIVLKVQPVGENDRLCTLLTERMGVIRAFARGAKSMKNRNFASTAQFVYGSFVLRQSNDAWTIIESSFEELFIRLRDDIFKLSLAQYLCELTGELAPQDMESSRYLLLLKAALYLLSSSNRSMGVIKAAAEMRMLSLAGYMPDLVMCEQCGAYEADTMFFSPRRGIIRCSECGGTGDSVALSRGAMAALRHTIYVDMDKTYAFKLEEPSLSALCEASERYLLEQTGRTFPTLDFYKSLLQM